MPIVGIRLRHCGPTLYCDSVPPPPAVGEQILVETEHGLLLGQIVSLHDSLPDGGICSEIRVLRTATDADKAAAKANDDLARRARRFAGNPSSTASLI